MKKGLVISKLPSSRHTDTMPYAYFRAFSCMPPETCLSDSACRYLERGGVPVMARKQLHMRGNSTANAP